MLKSEPKNLVRDFGNLIDTVFGHSKDNFEKESKNFVREFETLRNNRERENLERCIILTQDAPDKFASGVSSLSRNVDGVLDKLKNSNPKFELLKQELDELKKRKSSIIDPFATERHDYAKEIEQSKIDYDKVIEHKEQELIKEYRVLMEAAVKDAARKVGNSAGISSSSSSSASLGVI
ncbi:13088_t:CDS:2 [Ambispora leptoticha]|uniref:Biogenesis of lysosome-related organelles complex 1 subunit 5 n=1 Tax=Ambispora leptoticha TaxID=144679 RepID=A0A9N9D162_9GLOM|nr:13088_t:CDS:2 [Ambispora leptoticha]